LTYALSLPVEEQSCSHSSRATFFSQRVLNVWNALPDSVDFASLNKFKQSILHIDFNDH